MPTQAVTPIKNENVNEPKPEASTDRGFFRTVVSAGLAGFGVAAATFPFEQLKKRYQGNEIPGQGFGKISNTFKLIAQRKLPVYGPGLGIFSMQVGPATAIAFSAKQLLGEQKSDNLFIEASKAFAAGAMGATVATVVEGTVRRQQIYSEQAGRPVNAVTALGKMVREHGIASPFQSYAGISGRDGIFTLYMMFALPQAASFAQSMGWSAPAQYAFQTLVLFSGVPISHPFDTVATQVQQNFAKESYWQTISRMYQEDGVRSYFRGVSMRAILFPFYAIALPKLTEGISNLIDLATLANINKATNGLQSSWSTFFKPTTPQPSAKVEDVTEELEKQIQNRMN
jgi:hypothetical protein